MDEKINELYNNFQIADLDDDLIGMCKAMVNWMFEIHTQVGVEDLPLAEKPKNFYKLVPHQPRMELRRNYRTVLRNAVKRQEEEDEIIKIINIYITIVVGLYIYHMPVEKMVELSKIGPIDRETAKEILLADGMSPNWIKEPSNKDFTAMLI